jgi:hypothetical protein
LRPGGSGQQRNEQIGGGLSMVKKVILIVLGAVGILISAGVLIIGAVLLAVTGGDGFISAGVHDIHSDTPGLVTEPALLRQESTGIDDAGGVTIRFDITSDRPVFIGVGPSAEVRKFLGGAEIDEVTKFQARPFTLVTVRRGSPDTPLPSAPGDATFWAAKASGTHSVLDWHVGTGSYQVVLLAADSSPQMTVRAGLSARVPFLRTLAKWFVGGGVLGLAVAAFLLLWGIRTKRRHEPAFAGTYPGQFMPGFPSQPYGQPAAQPPYPAEPEYGRQPEYGQQEYGPPGGDDPPPGPAAPAGQPAAARPATVDQPGKEKPEGDGTGDTLGSAT